MNKYDVISRDSSDVAILSENAARNFFSSYPSENPNKHNKLVELLAGFGADDPILVSEDSISLNIDLKNPLSIANAKDALVQLSNIDTRFSHSLCSDFADSEKLGDEFIKNMMGDAYLKHEGQELKNNLYLPPSEMAKIVDSINVKAELGLTKLKVNESLTKKLNEKPSDNRFSGRSLSTKSP